jgi:hypothetical protein
MRDGREKTEKGGGGCFLMGMLGMGRIRLGFMNIYGLLVGCWATSGWPKIRDVPRAGPPCRECGPGPVRPSGRASPRHYRLRAGPF